jgi:hypothetical protein
MPHFSLRALRAFLATLVVLLVINGGIWFNLNNVESIENPIVQRVAKEGGSTRTVSTDSGSSKYRLDNRPNTNHTSFQNTNNAVKKKSWIQQYATTDCACKKLRVFKKLQREAGWNQTILFIHVPKTGGTTLEDLMKLPKGSCHAAWSQYEACDGVAAYRDALTFASVRHPLTRAVSMYRYALQMGNGSKEAKKKFAWVQGLDFPSFVEALPKYIEVVNFHPQTKFVTDDQGVLQVNRILCTESLGEDWNEMKKGLPTTFGKFSAGKRLRSSIIPSNITVSVDTEAKLKILYDQDFRLWEQHCNNTI